MIKDVLKRQTTIIAVAVIGICLCLMGVSYAIFFDIDKGNPQTVTSGTLTVQFTESNNGFITNSSSLNEPATAEPMDDSKGSTSSGYQFSVTNTGTLPMKYNIYLYDDPSVNTSGEEGSVGERLAKSYIKVMLDNESFTTLDSLTCEDKPAKDLGESGDTNISICKLNTEELVVKAKGAANNEATKEHIVRIWISSSAQESEIDKIIALKLAVLGEAGDADTSGGGVVKPTTTPFSDIIKPDNSTIYDDETDQHNIRYVGSSPSNYVWFNCEDYNNPSSSTCEKWRIIGLMKDVPKADGGKEDLVKIIRDEALPNYYVWDNKPSGTGTSESEYGSNNWADSRLMMLLNEGYTSNSLNASGATGSLYWNRQDGKCSAGTSSASSVSSSSTINCNFSTEGLRDGTTKDMIEKVKWNLGGTRNYSSYTASNFYTYERETETCKTTGNCTKERPTTWDGYIGLMYPSDYGFAAQKSCWSTALYSYNSSCYNSDWLYITSTYQWTLTPLSSNSNDVFYVGYAGLVLDTNARLGVSVRPTLYLKSSVRIKSGEGNGSSGTPYILVP